MHYAKFAKRVLSFILTGTMILASSIASTAATRTTVTISPEYEAQTFKGWGTSLSWWGN